MNIDPWAATGVILSQLLITALTSAVGALTSIIWSTRTRQGMTIAAPSYYPDGSNALLGTQFVDY
jgi:hypothetical protein